MGVINQQSIDTQRVYSMFGEGDEGEEVLYWIQTGDTATAYEWHIPE